MLTTFKNAWKSWGQRKSNEDCQTTTTSKSQPEVLFLLSWKNKNIGTLGINNGLWMFVYSDESKNGNTIDPLANFPKLNEVYESEVLWPFFHARIPTADQPMVKRELEKTKDGFNPNDEVEMLKRFGRRTVSNPYILEAV